MKKSSNKAQATPKQTGQETEQEMSEVVFQDVRGEGERRELVILNPSKFKDEGIKGVIVTGRYVRTAPNKFKPGKDSYIFETADGKDVLLDNAGNLAVQMKEVKLGELVQITYKGMSEIKKGPMKGNLSHDFNVKRAVTASNDD